MGRKPKQQSASAASDTAGIGLMGAKLGQQFEMFEGEDRTPAVDIAAWRRHRAACMDRHEGQEVKAQGFRGPAKRQAGDDSIGTKAPTHEVID